MLIDEVLCYSYGKAIHWELASSSRQQDANLNWSRSNFDGLGMRFKIRFCDFDTNLKH